MQTTVTIISGTRPVEGYSRIACAHRFELASLSSLSRDEFLVLDLCNDELQEVLGTVFRRKRPFALTSLDGMSSEQLRHLGATLAKRRITAYLLGGRRLLPAVSAMGEILGGGCGGDMQRIRVCAPSAEKDGAPCWQGMDVLHWLSASAGQKDVPAGSASCKQSVDAECLPDVNGRLRVEISGSVSKIVADVDFDNGEGELVTTLGGHRRVRTFEASDVCGMEMNVLRAFGHARHCVPGLVPINALIPVLLGAGASQSCPAATASSPEGNL